MTDPILTAQAIALETVDRATRKPASWRDFFVSYPNAALWFEYHEAPEELKALSSCGGDEDQIIVHRADSEPRNLHKLENLSCCSNEEFEFEGFIVWIGCHS